MARSPVRDERQGDLFGAPPPAPKPPRRAVAQTRLVEAAPAREIVSRATLGQTATRADIDDLLDGLPDQELAYLVVEATRIVKRRITRGQGRGLRPKGGGKEKSLLEDAMRRIGGELSGFSRQDEAW
jgi:hypothetical protein